jgi:ribose transport system substrate-binding protein
VLRARHSKIKLVGFDSSPMLLGLMQEGWVNSLVIQDPFQIGETAFTEAVKAMRGEKTPKKIFLPPHLLDMSNLHDPAIQAQLHPDLKKYLGSDD